MLGGGGVCAQRGELYPAAHARFFGATGEQGGGVVVDGFENAGVAAHDADAVHHGVAAFEQGHGGVAARAQEVEFGVRGGADAVSGFAQAAGGAAADKAAAAEEEDVHGGGSFFGVGRGGLRFQTASVGWQEHVRRLGATHPTSAVEAV